MGYNQADERAIELVEQARRLTKQLMILSFGSIDLAYQAQQGRIEAEKQGDRDQARELGAVEAGHFADADRLESMSERAMRRQLRRSKLLADRMRRERVQLIEKGYWIE